MSEQRHTLTITLADTGVQGDVYRGQLLFPDGTECAVYRSERTRIIAWAQREIERRKQLAFAKTGVETLILDADGIIVREPDQHSIRVAG